MSSPRVDPQLAPGISADTWSRILTWSTWIGIAVLASAYLIQLLWGSGHFTGGFFASYCAFIVYYLVLALATSLRSKREAAAGYTTLWRARPELVQLDSRTGALVRRAGAPYLPRPNRFRPARHEPHLLEIGSTRSPSIIQRLGNIGWRTAILLVGLVIVFIKAGWLGVAHGMAFALTCIGLLAFVAVITAVGAVVSRGRLARIRALAPDSFVFLFAVSADLRKGLGALGYVPATLEPLQNLGVSATPAGLTLWQENPPEDFAILPWASVLSVQRDSVSRSGARYRAVLVTFRDENGVIASITFSNANAQLLPLPPAAEAAWIVNELNQLRASGTSAQHI
jgi:hypothetical protein